METGASPELELIKEKARNDSNYEPNEEEIGTIKEWAKNPEVFLDEGQLQKVYGFEQGSIWDFFLHALNIKTIPTPKERVENGFESYIKTYNFNDDQIQILRDMKDIISANIAEKRKIAPVEIFNNPIFARIIGKDYDDVNQAFNNRFPEVFNELQSTFKA